MSFDLALLMSGLDPFIFRRRVVERTVGGRVPSPPRPTFTHRFSPYSQFASSSSVLNKSIASSCSSLNIVQASSLPSISSHSATNSHSSRVPPTFISSLSVSLQSSPPEASLPPPSSQPTLAAIPSSQTRSITPRTPQTGRAIAHNSLRPRVAAADRLFGWDTPFGIRHREELAKSLPPPLAEAASMSIRGALAPNSKGTYAAGILRFNQFCDKHGINEEACMPASYALLCAFIGEHKGKQSGNTIKGWLSGIRSFHLVNHAPWYGDDEWVRFARTSANKEGMAHKRPLRAPVSIEHLSCLRRALDLSNPFHAAIWAVALCTFWGCRRLGETTVSSAADFDAKYHVLRSTLYVALLGIPHIPYTNTPLESHSVSFVIGRALHISVFLGPRPPRKRVL